MAGLHHVGKAGREHAGHAGGVLDVLRGHPLLGLSLKLAPGRVVLQRADSAPGDGGVQLHVGAVESIGGVVEVSQGQRSAALEVRNPGPEQQGNRIGPRHPLSGDAPGSGASNGQESAGAARAWRPSPARCARAGRATRSG